jgi:hypothetical protein
MEQLLPDQNWRLIFITPVQDDEVEKMLYRAASSKEPARSKACR